MVKGSDVATFAVIVRAMRSKEHLTRSGFERLVRLAYGMNAHGKQRTRSVEEVLAGSSETVRGAMQGNAFPANAAGGVLHEMRQSDPHGDMGS